MRRVIVAVGIGCLAVVCAACGSSGGSTGASAQPPVSAAPVLTVGTRASESSKMICGEAKPEIAASLGVTPTMVTTPTWIDDVYSCSYVYRDGSFTLSVKELNGIANAAQYFEGLKTQLGVKAGSRAPELGQAAFETSGNGLVVQKDNKVLTVDVSKLAPGFGPSQMSPQEVALGVGGVIMGCWTGA